jgi:uncharacterized membrane protein YjjP (DUF1212 family)
MDYEQLLDGCAQVGCRLLAAGAEIYRVEDTVGRLLSAYGVHGDVFALPNTLIVTLTDGAGEMHTCLRRTGPVSGTDIEVIERFNALSRKVCADRPDPAQLPRLVEETASQCRTYSTLTTLVGYFLGGFFFTLLFSGGLLDALVGGIAATLSSLCVMALGQLRVNFFFQTMAAAMVLGVAAYGLCALGLPVNMEVTMIGALMVLVPGLIFTNFLCDLITGDALSGVSTFIRAILTATALAVGAGAALALFQALGLSVEGTGQIVQYGALAQLGIAFLACAGFAIMYNVHGWGGATLCCLGGALGWAVYLAFGVVTDSTYLRYAVAAVCIAAYAEVMARLRKYPITAYLVVSYFPLVPGSYIYYAMYYAIQGQRQLALESGIRALGLAACIATGTLFVTTCVRTYATWKEQRGSKRGAL